MPIHDWTRVDAGIFHDFHHEWISEIKRALNRGILPPGYYALAEQVAGPMGPDVLTLRTPSAQSPIPGGPGGVLALADAPPRVRFHATSEADLYAAKAKSVVIHHTSGHEVVAIVEIVSRGNKGGRSPLDAFARKAKDAIAAGIHLLVIDLYPPGPRDPGGIHPIIWNDFGDEVTLPADKPLTCASYIGRPVPQAFVEPVAVGDVLPEMPLFLTGDVYVPVPLEATYLAAWDAVPAIWRDALTGAAEP